MLQNIYEKPRANILVKSEKLNTYALKIRNKTKISILTASIQPCTGGPSQSNKAGNKNKKHPD